MNTTRTWIVTGSLAALATTGVIAAAVADGNDDRPLTGVTVGAAATPTPSSPGPTASVTDPGLSAVSAQTSWSAASAVSAQTSPSAPSAQTSPSAPSAPSAASAT